MKAFKYAFEGVFAAVKSERNMRIHLAFAFYVLLAGIVTKISLTEWVIIIICMAAVMSLELLNTAVEALCDEVSAEYSPKVKLAKDTAAGAVLVSAIASAIIGCIIFFSGGRPMMALEFAQNNILAAGIIVLTLPLWIIFIFKIRRSHK